MCVHLEINEVCETSANLAFEMQLNEKDEVLQNLCQYYITFHLQKTLPLSKLSTGIAFYLHQLWLFN